MIYYVTLYKELQKSRRQDSARARAARSTRCTLQGASRQARLGAGKNLIPALSVFRLE